MEGNSTGAGVNASSAVNTAEVGQPQSGEAVENTANNVPDAEEQSDVSTQTNEEINLDLFFQQHPEAKKENDKRIQSIVQKRMHQVNKSMREKNDFVEDMMAMHEAKDVKELHAKLKKAYAEEYAIENGVSNDIGEKMMDLRVRERRDAIARENYEMQMKAERQFESWMREAEEVKKVYPDFNLEDELENPRFRNYLTSTDERFRMPMKQIFEMFHHEELVDAAEKRAAAAYAQSVNANISRPVENGTGNQSAVSSMSEVSKLTRKQRAEFATRAMRGEKISF